MTVWDTTMVPTSPRRIETTMLVASITALKNTLELGGSRTAFLGPTSMAAAISKLLRVWCGTHGEIPTTQ